MVIGPSNEIAYIENVKGFVDALCFSCTFIQCEVNILWVLKVVGNMWASKMRDRSLNLNSLLKKNLRVNKIAVKFLKNLTQTHGWYEQLGSYRN